MSQQSRISGDREAQGPRSISLKAMEIRLGGQIYADNDPSPDHPGFSQYESGSP